MLKEYLEKNDLAVQDFARLVKVSDKAVYKWMSGERLPSDRNMHSIMKVTDGKITPNDFYGVE